MIFEVEIEIGSLIHPDSFRRLYDDKVNGIFPKTLSVLLFLR